jgi:hypothetical protein
MSKILACLSGGVESTYGVYRLLKETTHDVTLFHLYFRNHPRYEGETEACEHITNWLEKNTRKFKWISADLSYNGVDKITQPPHSADICYTITTAANICIDEKDYDEVRFFINKEEWDSAIEDSIPTFDYPFMVYLFNSIVSRFPTIDTKLGFDRKVGKLNKKEVYEKIPEDLRKFIHSNDKEYNVQASR